MIKKYKINSKLILLRRLLVLSLTPLLFLTLFTLIKYNQAKNVKAFGDLQVVFKDQITLDGPIFNFDDFKPGDCTQESQIEVTNAGINTALVAIRSTNVDDPDNFSQALEIIISENSNDLYGGTSAGGPKKLADFFNDSANPD